MSLEGDEMRSCRMSEPITRPVDFWFMGGGVAIGSGRGGGFAQDCHGAQVAEYGCRKRNGHYSLYECGALQS